MFCNVVGMARRIRHHVPGGWYHITTRGVGRRCIFQDDHDRQHFVELLEAMVERYGVVLHAYVLMDNHYHLLIETPVGNASRALQWLNVSYAVWFNHLHDHAGALFQARFKSIPVEEAGSWALVCSLYIHLNPVRIRSLGQGKTERAREKAGLMPSEPVPEQIRRRLEVLRGHRWSSYPAYAGTAVAPEWLTRANLWSRVAGPRQDAAAAYRQQVEEYLRQGLTEGVDVRLTQALAIGSTAFIEKLRRKVARYTGHDTNAKAWRRLLPFAQIVQVVTTLQKRSWDDFANRRGDWGRDMALLLGRTRGGMTLRELGKATGMNPHAVSKAVTRLAERLPRDARLHRVKLRALRMLEGSAHKA